jgi:hypothetical protein
LTTAFILTLAFALASCGDSGGGKDGTTTTGGSGSGGTFTVTGIPAEYNGKYAGSIGTANSKVFMGAEEQPGFAASTHSGLKMSPISNGSVSMPMWVLNDAAGYDRYTGNVTFEVFGINIYDSQTGSIYPGSIADRIFESVQFTNGSATRSWSQGH